MSQASRPLASPPRRGRLAQLESPALLCGAVQMEMRRKLPSTPLPLLLSLYQAPTLSDAPALPSTEQTDRGAFGWNHKVVKCSMP